MLGRTYSHIDARVGKDFLTKSSWGRWSDNYGATVYHHILEYWILIESHFTILMLLSLLFWIQQDMHGLWPDDWVVNSRLKPQYQLVRAHSRNFWLGKAFFSRIWHAVVLTQFEHADSKSAPCQAIFCVFPTQNSKTKWPPKLVKMSQLNITAWLTMNIKTPFRCIKTHLSNILEAP